MPLRLRVPRLAASCLATLVATAALGGAVFVAPAGAAADQLAGVTITGLPDEKPTVAVDSPVSVKSSVAKVVTEGSGSKAKKGATISVDYVLLNGRTGAELETSYGASTVPMRLDRASTLPVLIDSLVGERVGSRVVIAIAPNDAPRGASGTDEIKKSDTLVFVLDVQSAYGPFKRATGDAVVPVDGLPTVKLAKNGAPTITMPKTDAPTSLVVQPLVKGDGPEVQAGRTIKVHYTGAIWDGGKVFDSSWKAGDAVEFPIGAGRVIKGWDDGLVGQTVGSQVLLAVPPDLGYGPDGNADAGIEGTDTLVFVVDILDAT